MINAILVVLTFTCILLLGSSRMLACIRLVAAQGFAISLLPLLANSDPGLPSVVLSASGMALKGAALPWLMIRALKKSEARREVEPFVGFNASILAGVFLFGLACWITRRLEIAGDRYRPELLSVALFVVFTGLFLIVSRRKAITQALGYLVLENGIYAVGTGIGQDFSAFVEFGVLLDVFVGIFLMGIIIFHIDREFDHIDTDRMTELTDVSRRMRVPFRRRRRNGGVNR